MYIIISPFNTIQYTPNLVSTFSPEIFCGALLGITLYWADGIDSKMPRLFAPSSSNSLSTTWTCASSGPQAAAFGQISELIPPSQTNKGTNELPSWRTISILFGKDWAETPEPCKLQALGNTRFADVHRYSICIWWKYYWIIITDRFTRLTDAAPSDHLLVDHRWFQARDPTRSLWHKIYDGWAWLASNSGTKFGDFQLGHIRFGFG
jgi:hypothetical protein